MYKIPPKRKQLWQRVLVYTAMTTVVIGATTVLFLLMIGYRFNAVEGEFEQGGLAQFVTRPTGATVTVGSAKLAAKTPSKITLNTGSYTVKMELAGYRTWSKDVSINAGQVLWLNSVRFVPQDPQTEQAATLRGFGSMTSRTQGDVIAIIEDATKPTVTLFNISAQDVAKKSVTIPASVYTKGKTHSFALQAISRNDRFAVVRHTYDGKQELLAVDLADPSKSMALKVGDEAMIEAKFDPRSGDRVYGRTAKGAIYSVDLPDRTLSDVLASKTERFAFAGDRLLLFTVRDKENGIVTVNAQRLGESRTYQLESLKTAGAVQVTGGYYYGDLYIAAAVDKTLTLWKTQALPNDNVLDNKEQTIVNQIILKEPPTALTIRGSGRFVFAEQKQRATLYDIELQKTSVSELIGDSRTPAMAGWLDEYHYWYRGDGKLAMSEFDGSNVHLLAEVESATDAVLSSSGRYLYSVGRDSKNALQLQRTIMVLR